MNYVEYRAFDLFKDEIGYFIMFKALRTENDNEIF